MTHWHAILLLSGIAWLSIGVFVAGYVAGYDDRKRERR